MRSVIRCKTACPIFGGRGMKEKSIIFICYQKSKQTLCSQDAHTAGTKITKTDIATGFIIFIPVFVKAKTLTLIHPLDLYKNTTVATGRIPQSAKHTCHD